MKKALALVAVLLLVVVGVANAGSVEKIDIEGLKALKASDEQFVVIDSRGGKYFDGEVIEGAKHLAVNDQTAEKLAELVPSKDTKIVFYCSNVDCPASEGAAVKAKEDGYTNVVKYPGGFEEWKKAGLPTSKI